MVNPRRRASHRADNELYPCRITADKKTRPKGLLFYLAEGGRFELPLQVSPD